MHSMTLKDEDAVIAIEGIPKVLLIGGAILFLVQNILYYIFLFYLSVDILGASLFTLSFLILYINSKKSVFLVTGISYLMWMISTILWRFLIFQNQDALKENLKGDPEILIIFGISAFIFFISFFLFFKVFRHSENFREVLKQNKRFIELYLRIFLIYLLLHLSFSIGIIVGGLYPSSLRLWEISLFFKLLFVPIFGSIVFGGIVRFLTKNFKSDE